VAVRTTARQTSAFGWLAAILLAGLVTGTVAIAVATGGSFTYTLDDPYISLALSREIAHLHYGINPGEVATPSSSLLWPILLAPFAWLPGHALVPLLLGVAATLASGWLMVVLLDAVTDGASNRRPVLAACLAALPFALLGWGAVVFTGLEHAAHVTACLAVGVGLVEVSLGRPPRWWLVAGLVAGPLLRYEGLAVTGAAVVLLFCWGHRRLAVGSLLAAVLPLATFSAFAMARGLPPLPSSVLVKSAVVDGNGSTVDAAARSVAGAAHNEVFVALFVVLVGFVVLRRRLTGLEAYALTVLTAHALVGQFGWFHRYELYAFAAVLPVLVLLSRGPLVALMEAPRRAAVTAGCALAIALYLCLPYLRGAVDVPTAAAGIHAQQGQMARFVRDFWHEPVAVSDLGLVSYEGGQYVVDLHGLASEEARIKRRTHAGTGWMQRLAHEHGVTLVMIYYGKHTIAEVPSSWTQVGVLSLTIAPVTVAADRVTFFATAPTDEYRLRRSLREFARTLPAGSRLTLTSAR
jgi:hypothetical protein